MIEMKNVSVRAYILVVFIIMLVFFGVLHPIPIMDGDDMIYISYLRPAIPFPNAWNPSRVLPEVFMPICGSIAGICASLGLGTFIDCQVAVFAVFLSGFISFYIYALLSLIKNRAGITVFESCCIATIFLMLHFLVFRSMPENNSYMFKSYDACCVFFYTIPAMLNSGLVMLLMGHDSPEKFFDGLSLPAKSFFITAVYFAIFSNLFGSIILSAYLGCTLLFKLFTAVKKKSKAALFLKENYFTICALLLWCVALGFEALGGRADSLYGGDSSFISELLRAINVFLDFVRSTSLYFKILYALSVLAAIVVIVFLNDDAERKEFFTIAVPIVMYGIISAVFLFLLCAVVYPTYMQRTDATFVLFFTAFLVIVLCIIQVIRKFRLSSVFLPLFIVFVFSLTNTSGRTFADSNPIGINGILAVEIQNDICEQIIFAAERGENTAEVYVLDTTDDWANWPHNPGIGDTFSAMFYKFGIIDKMVDVTVVPSVDFNLKYGLSAELKP